MDWKIISLTLVLLLFVGCTQKPDSIIVPTNHSNVVVPVSPTINVAPSTITTPLNASGVSAAAIANTTNANNQFATEFYSNLKNQPAISGKNIFYSPYSISTAFAMVYEGAIGQTADEIQSVFHFSPDASARRSSMADAYNRLNPPNASYALSTANALWIQNDYPLLPDYTSSVEQYYGGKATNLDFKKGTEPSRLLINSWVENKTNGKIKDLFASGMIDTSTRVVLTNTVYFKGAWANPFANRSTSNKDFRSTPSKTISVPMMNQIDWFAYTETDSFQALELPYEDGALSMIVILPKSDDLSSVESQFNMETLGAVKGQFTSKRVDVSLPKFKFASTYLLNDNLAQMGMPSAFSPSAADFSGMTGNRDLSIGVAIHKAFIDVNEEGTEAAAATGIAMVATASPYTTPPPPPIVFKADHPYLFLIQEKETGNILFIGRVVNPIASGD